MRKEDAAILRCDFPDLYGGAYIECGRGWFYILYKLGKDITKYIDTIPGGCVRAGQIKEKFAVLCFYYHTENLNKGQQLVVDGMVSKAERDSEVICEVCGSEGRWRDGGWQLTLCDKHHKMNQNGESIWNTVFHRICA